MPKLTFRFRSRYQNQNDYDAFLPDGRSGRLRERAGEVEWEDGIYFMDARDDNELRQIGQAFNAWLVAERAKQRDEYLSKWPLLIHEFDATPGPAQYSRAFRYEYSKGWVGIDL